MLKYTLKRLVNAFVVLFIIATTTWFLMQLLPGSPIQTTRSSPPSSGRRSRPSTVWTTPCWSSTPGTWANLARGPRELLPVRWEARPGHHPGAAAGLRFPGHSGDGLGVVGGLLLGIIGALKQNSICGQRGCVPGRAGRLRPRLRARAACAVLARVPARDSSPRPSSRAGGTPCCPRSCSPSPSPPSWRPSREPRCWRSLARTT